MIVERLPQVAMPVQMTELDSGLVGLGTLPRLSIRAEAGSAGGEQAAAEPLEDADLGLEGMARAMTSVPAAVAVEPAAVPELTASSLENTKRLFALTVGELADIFGVTERQMHRYLREARLPDGRMQLANALAAVGLTIIAGLGPEGAHKWLYTGAPTGAELARAGRIEELAARAESLRDSPFT
jgi:AraC-like DNA-binding protein